jgi:hypothetical protein
MGLRWRRRGAALLVAAVGLVGATGVADAAPSTTTPTRGLHIPSGANDCMPAAAPAVSVDLGLDRMFADQLGPGWLGGDSSYSTALPGGRDAFVFSDTLIGTAQAGGTASFTGVAHNSELYGWLPRLQSDYGGTFASPQPLIPDTLGNGDRWEVGATFVEGGQQLVFVNEYAPLTGIFDRFTGRSAIAVLFVRRGAPALMSIVALGNDPSTSWGSAFVQVGGYTYVYGEMVGASAPTGMRVARVPVGEALRTDAWRYWTGASWVAGESNATALATGNALTGVVPQPHGWGFEAVSIPSSVFTDTTLDLSYACAPEGPWSAPVSVYAIPPVAGLVDQLAYIPTVHPELSRRGGEVISYNVNSAAGLSALQTDIHGYQPHFIVLRSGARVRLPGPPAATPETPTPLLLPALAAAVLLAAGYLVRRRRAGHGARRTAS